MKKLSLLIAMILCLTVGGVYATWTFTANQDVGDKSLEYTLTLTDYERVGDYGTYTINTDSVIIKIDQVTAEEQDANSFADHQAILRIDPSSKVIFTFTPSENAPANIKTASFNSWYYLGQTREMQAPINAEGHYDTSTERKDVFVVDALGEPNKVLIAWEDQGDGSFTFTLDAEDLADLIKLNGKIILDTLEDYNAFKADIAGNFVFYITDGIVSGS